MNTTIVSEHYKMSMDRKRHGSLYDRGSADSYYHRGAEPHWYPQGSYNGHRITNLTTEQVQEYMQGYNDNEECGNKKDWGN